MAVPVASGAVSKKMSLTTLMSRSGGAARSAWAVKMFEGAGLGSLAILRVSSVLRWSVQSPGHVEQSQRGTIHRGGDVAVA